MAVIQLTDRTGARRDLEAVEGWRVMEILREHRAGIDGLCGGACDCGTCHVVVSPEWAGRLPAPREEELQRLDELPIVEPSSRLACQIIWDDALDGLALTLPEAA